MDLADLKRELRRLEALAYSPRDALAAAEVAVLYRTLPAFEARMLESHGFLAEAEPWKNKLARLDSATAADVGRLRVLLDDLGVARFRRFFAAMIIGACVLQRLYVPPEDGPPRISRKYVTESVFIAPSTTLPHSSPSRRRSSAAAARLRVAS